MKVETDSEIIRKKAEISGRENERIIEAIESGSVHFEVLDSIVKDFYEEIKDKINCAECGECCRSVIVVFEEQDIGILADGLNMNREDVLKRWFHRYEKFDCYVMNQSPCPFQKENLCTVYESRGTECREFPYIDSKPFSQIYKYVFQGYSFCPVHFNIIEKIKSIPELSSAKEG